jgi:peptide chain release factor subunit 1
MNQVEELCWRQRINELAKLKESGTTMISLYVKSTQLMEARRLVKQELSSSQCIKSRATRHAVAEGLRQLEHCLKAMKRLPANGYCLFAGASQLTHFEPPKPVLSRVYRCSASFEMSPLLTMISDEHESRVALVVIDGHGALYGVVQGRSQRVLGQVSVRLPRKHRRGGQSAARFGRQRV